MHRTKTATRHYIVQPSSQERCQGFADGLGIELGEQMIDAGQDPAEIKNRVLRTAHGTNMGDGGLSNDLIAYHEARAKGGVGLSCFEASSVHRTGPMTMHAWDDSIIPRYQEAMKRIEPHGMRMFSQINHMGFYQGPPWARPWSASETPMPTGMVSHAMTKGEIDGAAYDAEWPERAKISMW